MLSSKTIKPQQFLPVEEAFQVDAIIYDGNLELSFTITPGHYLYKERFKFTPDNTSTTLTAPVYPQAKEKYDENFETVMEVFHEDLTIHLPIQSDQANLKIKVQFQGCAEAGLCYPPRTVTLELKNTNPVDTSNKTPPAPETFPDQENIFFTLLLFLLAGLGLALTPCVLPMIPILSSLLIGANQRSSNEQQGKPSKTLTLTFAYVLSMAATFALAGTLMGLFGASLNLQAKLQSPWLIYPFAAMFVVLSLSMFGVYELQLPQKIRDKLGNSQPQRGSVSGAIMMGILSALVVSPCVSAPLAGALIYISTTGNAVLGGLSLLAMGLGMGIPLILIGVGGKKLLPKAGQWMDNVKLFFGFMLLGISIWMLDRVIPGQLTLALWGSLAIGAAVQLGAMDFHKKSGLPVLYQTIGLMLLIYGFTLVVGSIQGNKDPLQPLTSTNNESSPLNTSAFIKVVTPASLNEQLLFAKSEQKHALIDVYADWCTSCKTMERAVYPDPEVNQITENWHRIKFDITDNTKEQQEWLNQHQLFGPPALLFFNSKGEEQGHIRTIGKISASQLKQKLQSIKPY